MNQELQDFGRKELKRGLAKCTDGERAKFKQMYAFNNRSKDIDYCVDNMSADKINIAMEQVKRTLSKKED